VSAAETAAPSGDQVAVQVEAAVCAGPELAAFERLLDDARGGHVEGRGASLVPGGAAVGRVVAAGDGAGHLAGRRVVVGPLDPCGECERCRRGLPFACPHGRVLGATAPGALGGRVLVRARWVTELQAGDAPSGRALVCDGPLAALLAREAADAYALYARAGMAAGEAVIVLGRGPVARLLVQIAEARGARVLAASAADEPSAAERARAHADEHAAGGRPLKIAAVPEQGDDELGLAVRLAGPGALVAVLTRSHLAPPGPEVGALLAGGGALVGVPAAHPDLVPEVAALAARGELDLAAAAEVVEHEPLDPAALAARTRAALASGKALVLRF
jgi:D-arabinose 1-dehydrogenase-like Zn-dependent alcohol dehydrogenase